MFRQDKANVPFNEIAHLTGESFAFSTNLRHKGERRKQDKEKVVQAPSTQMRTTSADGKPLKDEFAVKETNCTNTQCLHNNEVYALEFEERLDLLLRLEELQQTMEEQEQAIADANAQYETVLATNRDYTAKVNELGTRELEAKARRKELAKIQIRLEQEVRRMEKAKMSVVEDIQQQQAAAAVSRHSEIVFGKSSTDPARRKHNGVFAITEDGFPAWTCCNCPEHDGEGCAEDHSVGIRSALPLVKNFYDNQLVLNHPLQHGSSLFLDSSVRRSLLQVGAKASRSSGSPEQPPVHEASHNHLDSLRLGRGAAMDYFSVHKPAARVLAMQPQVLVDQHTGTVGVHFGAPPATAKYVADLPSRSVYSRPVSAAPTLQRASIHEVYPHLDKRVTQHSTEQRYTGVDYSKPPPGGAGVEGTKVYALYSLPYAHRNARPSTAGGAGAAGAAVGHGLLTQSVRSPSPSYFSAPGTSMYGGRPRTAGAAGVGVSGGRAHGLGHGLAAPSVASAVSWGQPVPEQSSIHRTGSSSSHPEDADEDAGSFGRPGSRDSNDSRCEGNRHPRFDPAVSSASIVRPGQGQGQGQAQARMGAGERSTVVGANLRRPSTAGAMLPRALPTGQKKVGPIGKQRAVPERVKLTPNRPLASPEGFKLYTL